MPTMIVMVSPVREATMLNTATIVCPHCQHPSEETMRVRVVERTIRCSECSETIETPADKHCVWCAYGDIPCPVVQNAGSCNPYK
jgi:DNA-directed RNA polymerase subunit RPC12/RpoP